MKDFLLYLGLLMIAFGVIKLIIALVQRKKESGDNDA